MCIDPAPEVDDRFSLHVAEPAEVALDSLVGQRALQRAGVALGLDVGGRVVPGQAALPELRTFGVIGDVHTQAPALEAVLGCYAQHHLGAVPMLR